MAQLHFGDQEARRPVADVDHDFDAGLQGEGYGALSDDKGMSPNFPPPIGSEAPLPVHHQRNDPLIAGKHIPPPVSAGYGDFDGKPEAVGEIVPPAPGGFGNYEDKPEEGARAVPSSGYGGLPDELTKSKDDGYTSFGIEESQDDKSENSAGGRKESATTPVEPMDKEFDPPPYESMAKELEDHPATGGGTAVVPPLKKDFVDFPEGDSDAVRGREAAPQAQGFLGIAEQPEERQSGPHGSSGSNLLEQEEREGAPRPGALGIDKDDQGEKEGGLPDESAIAVEPEGGPVTGSRGITDFQSLKNDNVDISEASTKEPDLVNNYMEGHSTNEPKLDDSVNEASGAADTSQFTSQIKSPIDDPKQRYAVDHPELEASRDDSSKQTDFSELKQEPQTDVPSMQEGFVTRDPKYESPLDLKQGGPLDDIKQEDSLEDIKPRSSVDDFNQEDSIANPPPDTDQIRPREAGPQAGFVGSAEQQEDREGVAPYQSAMAEEPEGVPATGSADIVDVPAFKDEHVDFSEASTKEPSLADDPVEGSSANEPTPQHPAISEDPEGGFAAAPRGTVDAESLGRDDAELSEATIEKQILAEDEGTKEPTPHKPAMAEEPEDGSTTESRGVIDVPPLKGDDYADVSDPKANEPYLKDDSQEVKVTTEPTPLQSAVAGESEDGSAVAVAEEPKDGPATGSRGIIGVQSLKEDYADISEANEKEPNLAEESVEGKITDEPAPVQPDIAEQPEGGSAARSRGIIDGQSLEGDYTDLPKANTKEPYLAEDSVEDKSAKEPAPLPSDIAEEPEGGSATGSRGIIDVQSLKGDYTDLSEANTKEPIVADDSMEGNTTSEPTPLQSAISEEPEGGPATESGDINEAEAMKRDLLELSQADSKEVTSAEDSVEGQSVVEPIPHQSAITEEPEGGQVIKSRGITDVDFLKGDSADFPEASTEEPKFPGEAIEENRADEPIPPQPAETEEREGDSVTGSRGIIDVQPLKGDDVDTNKPEVAEDVLLEGKSTDEPKVDEPINEASPADTTQFSAPVEDAKPNDVPSPGFSVDDPKGEFSSGADPIKSEDFSDLKQEPQFDDFSTEEGALRDSKHEGFVDFKQGDSLDDLKTKESCDNFKPESALDDPKQEGFTASPIPVSTVGDSNEKSTGKLDRELEDVVGVAKPEEDLVKEAKPEPPLDDVDQPKQALASPTDDDVNGCERFQGDDGKEKIKAEGYNIYTGEPENKVYDAVDVIGNEHEKPAYETEADAAVKPSDDSGAKDEALPAVVEEDIPKEVSGSAFQGNEQAREFETSMEPGENEEAFTQHVSTAVDQDVGLKQDDRDIDIEGVGKRENIEDMPADQASPEFAVDPKQEDLAQVADKPESPLDETKQREPYSHDVSAAVEQDAAFKPDVKDGDTEGVSMREYVPAEESAPESAVGERELVDLAEVSKSSEAPLEDTKQSEQAQAGFVVPAEGLAPESAASERELVDVVNMGKSSEAPLEDTKQSEKAQVGPADDGFEHFEGDDSKEKKNVDGLRDQHGSVDNIQLPNEQARGFGTGMERGEHEEPFTQHVSSPVAQDVGFKAEGDRDVNIEGVGDEAKDVPVDEKSPYTEIFKIDGSELEQDAGSRVDSRDREDSLAAVNKEVDVNGGAECVENVPAGDEKSPYTGFADTEDYAKSGYGAEGFVPKNTQEVDRELREPTERVDQGEDRRPTDEHPLDAPLEQPDQVAEQERDEEIPTSGVVYDTKGGVRGPVKEEGIVRGEGVGGPVKEEGVVRGGEGVHGPVGIGYGGDAAAKVIEPVEEPKKAPSVPHPQPEDAKKPIHTENRGIGEDEQAHPEAPEHHKKGIFAKIKEKLTPHHTH